MKEDGRNWYLSEIAEETGRGKGSLSELLRKQADKGVLERKEVGRRTWYKYKGGNDAD